MLPAPSGRTWLYHAPVDLRKSYRSLCAVVEQELKRTAKSGDAFVFVNRQRTLAKVLWWDRTGWCLLLKRLSAGKFRVSEQMQLHELQADRMRMFFDGL
ncbi:MAG: IS66 family insertion sequence element accessory protein TnpB [Bdellovibrionales bacterium]|nr:IS66 family insertion sequence element accessory protein TnpB [Bdellovibrionales bacterium]